MTPWNKGLTKETDSRVNRLALMKIGIARAPNKVVLSKEELKVRARERDRKRNKTPEYKAQQKAHRSTPEYKAKLKGYTSKYLNDNKDKIAKRSKRYYLKNQNKLVAYSIQYQKENSESILKSNKIRMNELGIKLGMNERIYRNALFTWSRIIRKDSNGCVICGSYEKLNAHHLLFKRHFPELSLNTNNGIVLCHNHHMELHHGTKPHELMVLQ